MKSISGYTTKLKIIRRVARKTFDSKCQLKPTIFILNILIKKSEILCKCIYLFYAIWDFSMEKNPLIFQKSPDFFSRGEKSKISNHNLMYTTGRVNDRRPIQCSVLSRNDNTNVFENPFTKREWSREKKTKIIRSERVFFYPPIFFLMIRRVTAFTPFATETLTIRRTLASLSSSCLQ